VNSPPGAVDLLEHASQFFSSDVGTTLDLVWLLVWTYHAPLAFGCPMVISGLVLAFLWIPTGSLVWITPLRYSLDSAPRLDVPLVWFFLVGFPDSCWV